MMRSWSPVLVGMVALLTNWPGPMPRSIPERARRAVLEEIVTQVLNDPTLEAYLHPEVAGRVPLVMSDHLLLRGFTLTKFGAPVVVIRDAEAGRRPHIRLEALDLRGNRA